MYGLPAGFDPTASFVGKTLVSVCFSVNTVSLRFEPDVTLTILSSFSHDVAGRGQGAEPSTIPVAHSQLMVLAGREVVSCEAPDPKTLVLRFDNGDSLYCYDDSTDYESLRITMPGRDIVV
jgi:hypothetical protein